jgi:hypothetical protein
METTKSIFQSKTFWFNLLTGLLGATALIGADQLAQIGINGTLQNQILAGIGVVNFIGNLVLRAITNTAVSTPLTPKQPENGI